MKCEAERIFKENENGRYRHKTDQKKSLKTFPNNLKQHMSTLLNLLEIAPECKALTIILLLQQIARPYPGLLELFKN